MIVLILYYLFYSLKIIFFTSFMNKHDSNFLFLISNIYFNRPSSLLDYRVYLNIFFFKLNLEMIDSHFHFKDVEYQFPHLYFCFQSVVFSSILNLNIDFLFSNSIKKIKLKNFIKPDFISHF